MLLLFSCEAGCLAEKLRSGDVHGAADREEALMPEIQWQQQQGMQVALRTDAAFAQ